MCLLLPLLGEAERLSLGVLIAVVATILAGLGLHENIERSRRPVWAALYLGLVGLVVGTLVRSVHAELANVEFPFPSPADVFVMAGYVLILAGQRALAKARRHENNRADLLDALLVGALVGIPFWSLAVVPFLLDSTVAPSIRILDGTYSVIVIAVLVATALLAVGPGKRNWSYYLLAFSMTVLFVIDTGALLHDMGIQQLDWVISYAFPLGFIAYAAATLRPDISHLTDRPPVNEPRLTRQRIALLVASVLLVPALLLWQVESGYMLGVVLTSSGSAIIALIVLARMTDLVRANERSIRMERVRSNVGEALVAAGEVSDIARATLGGIMDLVTNDRPALGILLIDRGDGTFTADTHDGRAYYSPSDAVRLDEEFMTTVHEGRPTQRKGRLVLESGRVLCCPSGEETILIPLQMESISRGIFAITTSATMKRSTRRVLESIIWEACLALRSLELGEQIARERTERRYRAMFERSTDIVSVTGPDGVIHFCSPAALRALGREPTALIGRTLFELVHTADRQKVNSLLRYASSGRTEPRPVELRMRHRDKSVRWFEVLARDLTDEPEIEGIVITARDITERKTMEQEVSRSEARFRSLVQNSSDIVAVLDDDGRFTYLSPAVTAVLGFSSEELIGLSAFTLLHQNESELAGSFRSLVSRRRFAQERAEVSVTDKNGKAHTLELAITDLRSESAVHGVVVNARDVSVNKELESSLEHQALHDGLTGLPNRDLFSNQVAEALSRAEGRVDSVAVLLVDVDDFKTVNDSLGHQAGDQLLIDVADRILQCLRLSDSAARLGGDEFGLLLEHCQGEREAVVIAAQMLDAIAEPLFAGGRPIQLTASIGVSLVSEQARSAELLLRNADMAMYLAKGRGKARFALFEDTMQAAALERMDTKSALAIAVDRNELVLYYQPIVSMDGSSFHGAEALVRWKHPQRGLLGPGAFIPLAEETGVIVPIGSWIVNEALRQLSIWRARNLVDASFRMGVNLSVRQLDDPRIVDCIEIALARYCVPPASLTIEVTESLLVGENSEALLRLEGLRSLGVAVAIDDFGTGYSSLSYIGRFPIDILKIDRSFVDGLGGPSKKPTIASAIIDLARRIGAQTVAEGIEKVAELEVLLELGCDYAQGYLFSRPVPAAEFVALLTAGVAPLPRPEELSPLGSHADLT